MLKLLTCHLQTAFPVLFRIVGRVKITAEDWQRAR